MSPPAEGAPRSARDERVLIVSSLWPPTVFGGAELYAAELAARLRDRGATVGAVTLGVEAPDVVAAVPPFAYRLDEYADQGRARRAAFHVADLYRPTARRVLAGAIRAFRPTVVHSHAVAGLSTSALTTPSAHHVAHVHTLHDYWLVCQRSTLVRRDGTGCDSICRGCAIWSDARSALLARHGPGVLIAPSRAAAAEHQRLRWARGRIRVIHPAVPEATSRAGARQDRRPGPIVFGFIGRLEPVKGVGTLVRAFADAALPRARLVLAGDGPLRAELERDAPAGVEILGWVDAERKDAFFDEIDCLVVPSEWREIAGLVVLEARARRIPVIGARIGGIPEMIAPESEPLLFRSGDAGELGQRLVSVAADPRRYEGSVASAASTWDQHVGSVLDAYADARCSLPSQRDDARGRTDA
jgi:glycosyltransferase involved in cell wall biosynthesis